MGIRGLYSYIIRKSEDSFEPFTLKNTKIIIDGRSISYQLFDLSQQHQKCEYIIGSDYESFSRYLNHFFHKLMLHNVDFLVILNGCFKPGNREKLEKKYTKCLSTGTDQLLYKKREGIHYASFKDDVFMSVIKKLNIKFLKCTFDADEVISVTSKILGYPILTACSDYFLYGNDCILLKTVQLEKYTMRIQDEMACKIYRSDKFIQSFPGLHVSHMPLLSVLMDSDYFNDELSKKILEYESSNNQQTNSHNKIHAALNWLSKYTPKSACTKISSILTPKGKSSKPIKTFIEAHINRYTTFSLLTFKFLIEERLLEITREKVNSVKDKFFKFKFSNKKQTPNDELYHKMIERDDDVIKQKVYDLTPKWLINSHSKGHIHSFIISMIGLRTFIPWFHLEDLEYPSAFEMSIPLITLIYKLVLSSTRDRSMQPLTLMTRKNCNLYYKEITVDWCPKNVGIIRKLQVQERIKIINNVLKVADSENFKILPENWRLYVATAIFWYKQDMEPKKNKNHLKALLLAMFFSTVKNIMRLKKYKYSSKRYEEMIKDIMSTNISHKNEEFDDIPLTQAIGNICRNDALIAVNYLMPLVKIQRKIPNQSSDSNVSSITIHIYSQFEICLNFSKTLNALLNAPYCPTRVELLLMRPLIHNLYLDISQHPNVDEYIAEKLNYAPTVLRCFKLLLKKVDSLLAE